MQQHKIDKFVNSESKQWSNSQNSIPGLLPDIATKHIQSRLLNVIKSNRSINDKLAILYTSIILLKTLSTKSLDVKLEDALFNYKHSSKLDRHSQYGISDNVSESDRLNLVSALSFLLIFAKEHIDTSIDSSESRQVEMLPSIIQHQQSILKTT